MRREPINDLVEQIRRSRQRIRAIPARANVAHDPDWVCASEQVNRALDLEPPSPLLLTPITRVLRILELVGQEAQDPRRIRMRHVDEVEVVVAIP